MIPVGKSTRLQRPAHEAEQLRSAMGASSAVSRVTRQPPATATHLGSSMCQRVLPFRKPTVFLDGAAHTEAATGKRSCVVVGGFLRPGDAPWTKDSCAAEAELVRGVFLSSRPWPKPTLAMAMAILFGTEVAHTKAGAELARRRPYSLAVPWPEPILTADVVALFGTELARTMPGAKRLMKSLLDRSSLECSLSMNSRPT